MKPVTTVDPGAGRSAKDVLSNLGVHDMDGVRALVSKEGLTEKSARQVLKGAEHYFNSGHDYRLTDDGNFNVITPQGAKTTSSKAAGNSKGFSATDLVGLGNHLSTFMGLVHKYNVPTKPATPTSSTGYEGVNTSNRSIGNKEYSNEGSGEGETKPGVGAKKVSSGKPSSNTKPVDTSRFEEAITKFHNKYNTEGKKKGGPGYQYSFPERQEDTDSGIFGIPKATPEKEARVNANQKKIKDFFTGDQSPERLKRVGENQSKFGKTAKDFLFGDLPESFSPENLSRIATVYNPAQLWSEAARGKARDLAKDFHDTGTISSTFPNTGLVAPIPGGKSMKTAKPVVQTNPARLLNSKNPLPAKQLTTAGELSPKRSSFKRVNETTKKKAIDKKASDMDYESGKFKKGGSLTAGEIVWGTPQMKKGGVLKAEEGAKIINYNTDGTPIYAPSSGAQFQDKMAGQEQDFLSGIQGPPTASVGTQEAASVANVGGTQETRTPQTENLFQEGSGVGDVAGKVAKYTLPFVGEALGRKQLNKFKPTPFTPANLMTGTVYDMPRPNMKLRYREPVGPDVQAEIGGQKFADAQQRDKETDFNVANAQSRIGQKQHIVDRYNQNTMFDAQGKRMWGIYGDQLRSQFAGMKAQSMTEPFVAAQQHLATDIASDAYLKSDRKALLAEQILKHEQPGSGRYEQALQYLGKGSKGMKFKTKFAHA